MLKSVMYDAGPSSLISYKVEEVLRGKRKQETRTLKKNKETRFMFSLTHSADAVKIKP